MFLTPEVFINIFVDFLIYIFFIIAFYISVQIVRYFDVQKDTFFQYALERRTYLVSVIVEFALFFKIILFFYFIFTLDKLSNIIPGAMCAAGVITANEYGVWLLAVKLLNLFLFGLWLLANKEDLNSKDYRFTKFKFKFFIFLFMFLSIEIFLEYLYFNSIDISKIVSCCGVLFNPVKTSAVSFLLEIPKEIVVSLFYLVFLLTLTSGILKKCLLYFLSNLIFILLSILAIIVFFSPYIYELPTHKCPFCFLQKEYYHIGYFIYSSLFLGTFFAYANWFEKFFFKKESQYFKISIFFNTIFVIIVTLYVLIYYLKNGVWLF